MNAEQLNAQELLQQFQIDDDDLELIRNFGQQPEADVRRLIEDFYGWLENQVWYSQYFSEGVPPSVQSLQCNYWQGFLEAQVDAAYVKQRMTVGRVHATINLPVTAYLAGMNFAQNWFSNLARQIIKDTNTCIALLGAINKLQQLDSNIVMHVYSLQSMDAIRRQGELTSRIVNEATRVVRSAATGNFDIFYQSQHETDALEDPINRMIDSLKRFNEETQKEKWLKSGIADLALAMRGGLSIEQLCDNAIRFLSPYLGAQVGVFYVCNSDGCASLSASYAFTRRKNLATRLEPGEGLVGQVLRERKPILLANVPADYITISSGLGEHSPRSLIAQPLIYDGQVKGVIELGTFDEFTDDQLEFLTQVGESIAVAINSAQDQEKMQHLLREAQQTSKKLQYQQEELESVNQTLEDQAQALKQSEEELTAQRDMLEESNKELQLKTLDLERQKAEIEKARVQLEEKAEQLANSSRYKSEFLANMSHELRTPLNSLLLLSQTLIGNRAGNLSEEQIEDLRVINSGGHSLLTLINDILDLSKVEAGKLQTVTDTVAFEDLMARLHHQFDPVASDNQLDFLVSCENELQPQFFTDQHRLEQILRNLLSNAFKFTHRGSVSLKIERPAPATRFTKSGLTEDNCLAFTICDTGIGIAADKQMAIFEAFQQADGSTSRAYGGTGLGLTISRELASLLGGEIQLQSKEGNGSCFTLFLPKQPPATQGAERNPPARHRPASPPPATHRQSRTTAASAPVTSSEVHAPEAGNLVLIIEDDPGFANILARLATNRGFKPLVVKEGLEALKLVMSHTPKAVILDMDLPDTDGLRVLESLKASPETRQIPIHIISGRDQDPETLRKGALGFLTKPVSNEELDAVFASFETLIHQDIKHILLVEDDAATCDVIREYLQNKHLQIHSSDSGELAMQILRQHRIDCCILDLNLSDMSGYDFLTAVEDDSVLSMPPLVIYTARDLSEEDYKQLRTYTDKIVVKDGPSPERLQEEVDSFLHTVDSQLPPTLVSPSDQPVDHTQALRGRKILLVDDDLRNVYALSKVLKEQGLVVILADNGELAVEKLKTEPDVDLVLMDIMMPVMDGYEAMRQIRADVSATIPIIALTAKAMSADREKCIDAGANDYMAKPVDVESLLSMVKNWCYH